jgi:hypothetical protein
MAKKWGDVAASAEFKALSGDEQEAARNEYFNTVIAPQLPESDVKFARGQFDDDTKPTFFDGVKELAAQAKDNIVSAFTDPLGKGSEAERPVTQMVDADRAASGAPRAATPKEAPPVSPVSLSDDLLQSAKAPQADMETLRTEGFAAASAKLRGEQDAKANAPLREPARKMLDDRTAGDVAHDYAVSLNKGIGQTVEMGGTIYGLISGDMDNTVRKTGEHYVKRSEAKLSPFRQQEIADQRQKLKTIEEEAGQSAAFFVALADSLVDPMKLVEQLPQLAVGGGAGKVVGGAVGKAAAKHGTTAAVGTTVAANAAMEGADPAGDAYDRMMALPDELWQQSDAYQAELAKTGDAQAAKHAVSLSSARKLAGVAGGIALGAAFLPGGRTIDNLLVDGVQGVGGRARRAGVGAAGESGGEALQEGGGAAGANLAVQQIDPSQQVMEGVGAAAGEGAGVGGPMGAAAGFASTPQQEDAAPTEADYREAVQRAFPRTSARDAEAAPVEQPPQETRTQKIKREIEARKAALRAEIGMPEQPKPAMPADELDQDQLLEDLNTEQGAADGAARRRPAEMAQGGGEGRGDLGAQGIPAAVVSGSGNGVDTPAGVATPGGGSDLAAGTAAGGADAVAQGVGFKEAFDSLTEGGTTADLYRKAFDSLSSGKSTIAGVKDPILARAKPAFDAGLIKSPDDIRNFEQSGYPNAKPAAIDDAAHQAATSPTDTLQNTQETQSVADAMVVGSDRSGDRPKRVSGIEQADGFGDIPKDGPQSGRANTTTLEGLSESAIGGSNLPRDVLRAHAASGKSFGSLDVPGQRRVLDSVRALIDDDKVFGSVVQSVPVDVMNQLAGSELAAKQALDDKAMFIDALSSGRNGLDVRSRAVDALVRSPAFAAAVHASPLGAGRSAETDGSTEQAGDGNGHTEQAITRETKLQPTNGKDQPSGAPALSIGSTPNNAEPITVKNGVVHVGKYPAMHFESGADVTVPAGADNAAIAQALRDAGVLSSRQRIYGLPKATKHKYDLPPSTVIPDEPAEIPQPSRAQQIKQQDTKARNKRAAKSILTADDLSAQSRKTFIKAIKDMGGIKVEEARDVSGEPAHIANRMAPGLFRKEGNVLDLIARRLNELGYLSDADYNDVDGGVQSVRDLIGQALSGEAVMTTAEQERYRELVAKEQELAEAMPARNEALADMVEAEATQDDDGLDLDALPTMSEADAMRAMGFSEEEINGTANGTQDEDSQTAQGAAEVGAAEGAATGAGEAGQAGFALEGQSPADVKAAEAKKQADAEEKAKSDAAAEAKAKADAERDSFTLAGSDRAADANPNQADIFGQPVQENPASTEREQQTSDELSPLTKAMNDLADVRQRIEDQGRVADDRLLERERQLRKMVKELERAAKPNKLDAAAASIDEELDAALNDLADALKKQSGQLNSGVDPAILALGVKVGSLYVAKGVVKFAQYSRAIIDALKSRGVDAEQIKPLLKQFYAATKQTVDDATFEQMDDDRAVRGFDLESLNDEPVAEAKTEAEQETKQPTTLDEFIGNVDAGYKAHFDYAGVDGRTVWIEKTAQGWVMKSKDDGRSSVITKGGARPWSKGDALDAAERDAEYRFTKWKPLADEAPSPVAMPEANPLHAEADALGITVGSKTDAQLRAQIDYAKAGAAPVEDAPAEKIVGDKLETNLPEVEHVTGKGKTLAGVVTKTLTKDQAAAVDKFTFRKDGGYFIRMKHVVRPGVAEQTRAGTIASEVKAVGMRVIVNSDSRSFYEGEADFNAGKPRVLPSYYTETTGKNAKDWYRGWDAANVAAPVSGATLNAEANNDAEHSRIPEQARPAAGDDQADRGDGRGGEPGSRPLGGGVAEADARLGEGGGAVAGREGAGGTGSAGSGLRGAESVGRGNREPSDVRDRPERAAADDVSLPSEPRADFVVGDDTAEAISEGGQKTKARNNIAAIRLVKKLAAEDRRATMDEQKALARYVGWGGIKQIFDDGKTEWGALRDELKALLTAEEYAAANRSILDAHFTSMDVVTGMWGAAKHLGFHGGRVLEPSVGVGNFFGAMPQDVRANSTLFGVELDNITGQIAKYLYPNATIATPSGFQDIEFPSGSFDFATGNPPFGEQSLYDRAHPEFRSFSIHQFFFAKALDKVRPGGILQMVVSRYLMDSRDAAGYKAREYLAQHARLLGAIRLPYNAFLSNANTEVVTDIIFLQKLEEGEVGNPEAWTDMADVETVHPKTGEKFSFSVNRYFADHPEMVVGTHAPTGKMRQANQYNVEPPDMPLALAIGQAVANLPRDVYRAAGKPLAELASADATVPEGTKVYGYYLDGETIMQRLPDSAGQRQARAIEFKDGMAPKRAARMIQIRDTLRSLMRLELSEEATDGHIKVMRATLNEQYDAFRKTFGYINQPSNRRAFADDPDLPLLESLEPKFDPGLGSEAAKKRGEPARKPSAEKADIFSKRVLQPQHEVKSLEAQQYGHLQSNVAMQDRLAMYQRAPQKMREQLEWVLPFKEAAAAHPAKPFSYTTANGKAIDDIKNVATPITEAFVLAAKGKAGEDVTAGEYRGMKIRFQRVHGSITVVMLKGEHSLFVGDYTMDDKFSPSGLFTRIENAISKLDEREKEVRAEADRRLAEIPKLEAEIAKPFAKEADLKAARQKHRETVSKLAKAGGGVELSPEMKEDLKLALVQRMLEGRNASGDTSFGFVEAAGGFTPILQRELDNVIKRVSARWERPKGFEGGRITAVDTPAGLPVSILRAAAAQNIPQDEIKGVLHNGHVYLVRENLKDAADAELTIFHEAYGHLGARLYFGPDAKAVERAMLSIWRRVGDLDGVRNMAERFGVLRDVEPYIKALATADMSPIAKQKIIVDELLAHVAGRGDFTLAEQLKAYVGALRIALRNAAKAMGLDRLAESISRFTDSELLWTLKGMRDAVVSGKTGKGDGTLFARAGQTETEASKKPKKISDSTYSYRGFRIKKDVSPSSTGWSNTYTIRNDGKKVSVDTLKDAQKYIDRLIADNPDDPDTRFAKTTQQTPPPGGVSASGRQNALPGMQVASPAAPTIQPPLGLSGGLSGSQASWSEPIDSAFDDFLYKWQDKHVDTRRVVQAVRDAAGQLADKWNPYLQEELFHGRAAKHTLDFVDRELKPLVVMMRLRELSMDDIDQYLWARHAKEANALIASRDPSMPDGGSGMTDADANAYFAALDPAKQKRLEDTAKAVDEIIARTRQMYAEYGLVSQDTVDGWMDMFQHYVPLMREDSDGAMGIGQGFSIKGKEVKHRTGSGRKVVDILANIALQREKVVVRGEKNRVVLALAGLAKLNPNPDFWSFDKVPTERVLNEKTGLVEDRQDPMFKSRPNVLVAKIKGRSGQVEERAIVFNDANERALRMAESLKNLDVGALEGVMGVSAVITRYFASVNTQYNPVFGFVNLTRDVQGAMLNLSSTPLKGKKLDVLAHTFTALPGIYRDARAERKGGVGTSNWALLWGQFTREGGQTGYRDLYRNSADRAKAIHHMLDPAAWMNSGWGKVFTAGGALKVPLTVAQKLATPLFNWLSDFNLTMENAVRLSAYKVAIDQGMSQQQAASLAKNLTVNFNRKGQVTQQVGALYAFFNASMQGSARLAETLGKMDRPGDIKSMRLSRAGAAIVGGGVLIGVMQAVLLASAGYEDDEPPEFIRERNLIMPLGWLTGKKDHLMIPMPLGYHVFPNIGRILAETAIRGGEGAADRVIDMISIVAGAFNPFGGGGVNLQTIMPTALDPLAALAENKDWTGKPIYRDGFGSNETPGFARTKDTASSYAKALAEGINSVTGGTEYTAGRFSPTPDQIDYLVAQVTGGVGRELGKAEQSITATMTGEELPPHKVPLLGRYYGSNEGASGQSDRFYANLKEANRHEAEIKGRRRNHEPVGEYLDTHPDAQRFASMGNRAERRIKALREQKRKLVKEGASRVEIISIEAEIATRMREYNDDFRTAKDGQ